MHPASGIQIKEEPDSEEWQLSGDSTLNPSDLNNLRVQMGDEEMEGAGADGKRLRRVACTCPNCKESGGRWASDSLIFVFSDFVIYLISFLSLLFPFFLS